MEIFTLKILKEKKCAIILSDKCSYACNIFVVVRPCIATDAIQEANLKPQTTVAIQTQNNGIFNEVRQYTLNMITYIFRLSRSALTMLIIS